jgi:hypothetical protein
MPVRLLSLLLVCAALPAAAQVYVVKELHLRYAHLMPSGGIFDDGFGLEGTVRRWQWDRLGYGLSLGLNDYGFNSSPGFVDQLRGGATVDGSAGYIPLQGSLLFAAYRDDRLALNLEAGLRYQVAVTSAEVRVPLGGGTDSLKIDLGDSVTGMVAAHLEFSPTGGYAIVLGAGYQQDIVQGEISVSETTVGDVELSGAFLHLGVTVGL